MCGEGEMYADHDLSSLMQENEGILSQSCCRNGFSAGTTIQISQAT